VLVRCELMRCEQSHDARGVSPAAWVLEKALPAPFIVPRCPKSSTMLAPPTTCTLCEVAHLNGACARKQRLECARPIERHDAAFTTIIAAAQELTSDEERWDRCSTRLLGQLGAESIPI